MGPRGQSWRKAASWRGACSLCTVLLLAVVTGPVEADDVDSGGLLELSLEELMQIEVTTVQGTTASWFSTPAAMTVITAEDIRRSGHRSLADVLRLVPGMFVGQFSSSFWKAGARGFTGAALPAPRNLVLIDGRTVYDPLFGGVFWDVQDVLLEDIDRIEVIRGPGATLWGPNAVNGVINIITKSAAQTQGALISGGGGTYEQGFGAARYGGTLGKNASYRAYLKYFEKDAFNPSSRANDDWSMLRGGFRIDGSIDDYQYTVQGDGYGSLTLGATRREPIPDVHLQYETLRGNDDVSGGNLLGRFGKQETDGSGWALQAYYDRTERHRVGGFGVDRDTFDVDFRNVLNWMDRQQAVWGLGYRATTDTTDNSEGVRISPSGRTFHLGSAFIQNTTELMRDQLFFMIGTKLTYFSETQWEVQPGGRIWWLPNDRNMLWVAISRPIRQPTRIELDGTFVLGYRDTGVVAGQPPSGVIVPVELNGSEGLDSERLLSYEAGYRVRLFHALTFDTVAFYNDYADLVSAPRNQIGTLSNAGKGKSYGSENMLTLQLAAWWQWQFVYSFLQVEQSGPVLQFEEENFAQNEARASSFLDLTDELELNTLLYYVDRLPQGDVPSYLRFDIGATWRPQEWLEFAVWGQDLLHDGHHELSTLEYPRGGYVQATLRF